MMKIMSGRKIALFAILVAVMMVMSMMAVSAAPVADAETANNAYAVEYTGTTAEAGVAALDAAMKQVEKTGSDVEFVLKSNIVIDPEETTIFTVGTDATSAGKLIVTSELDASGAPKYSITVSVDTVLHFKGNVQFKNIILDRVLATVSYYTGSYIFVTEGKAIFGDPTDTAKYGNITNPNAGNRQSLIAIAGSDLEVYSGNYVAVASNFRGSKMNVENPSIVFGGIAATEYLAGRGIYSYSGAKVVGKSTLTVKDKAKVTTALSAGHIHASTAAADLFGDAELNLVSGTVNVLAYAGFVTTGGSEALYSVDENTRSKYTINITGGQIDGICTMYYVSGRVQSIEGLDVTVNYGNATYKNYVYNGPCFVGDKAGSTITNSSVTANINNATFGSFFGGGYVGLTANTKDVKTVVDVDTNITIGSTAGVVFKEFFVIGSRIEAQLSSDEKKAGIKAADKIVYAEHSGSTTVTVNSAESRIVSWYLKDTYAAEYYGGSYLASQYASHTGDTTITMTGMRTSGGIETLAGDGTRYSGSTFRANNTSHTGNTTASYTGGGINLWNGANPVFALHNVRSGLTGVTIGGNAVTTVNTFHLGSPIVGGSVLNATVTNTGSTKLVMNGNSLYGSQANVQFYGGDFVKFKGTNDDAKATSELVLQVISHNANNTNDLYFGGSRIVSAGKTYVNSSVSTGSVDPQRNVYAGSDIKAAGGEHAGTSTFNVKAGTTLTKAVMFFGGSRIAEAGTHSGASYVKVERAFPIKTSSTETLFDEVSVFGGSDLLADNAKQTGASKVIYGSATVTAGIVQDTFGGSRITAAAEHSGKSEILLNYGQLQNVCNVFGGSYLGNAAAVQSGASALTITKRDGTSTLPSLVYGGSYILSKGAKHTGSSTFEFSEGTIGFKNYGAGSYALEMADDSNGLDDKILGGFAQGDVYFIVNGGTLTTLPKIAGNNVNVDGDVSVIIRGGIIPADFATLNNGTSVKGDLILKISGGTFKGAYLDNGTLALSSGTEGVNVVTGTYYTEFVEDGDGNPIVFGSSGGTLSLQPVGRAWHSGAGINNFKAAKSWYVRIVGDFDSSKLSLNYSSRSGLVSTKILDYTQCTQENFTICGSSTHADKDKIYYPMNKQAVTISRIAGLGSNATLGDYVFKATDTLVWTNGGKQTSVTYATLTAYDYLTEYKNAPAYIDVATGNGVSVSTTAIKLVCGMAVPSNETITLPSAATALLNSVLANYTVSGSSLRTGNLAMRCRAKISTSFFEADGVTAKDMGGYKISKLGILVSLKDEQELTFENTNMNAVAWENGELKVSGNDWAIDEGDDNNFYFAAAITGYGSNDSINGERAKTPVYFRGYVEFTYDDGSKVVIYLNNPRANDDDNTYTNYGRALSEVATILYDENPEGWLDKEEINRETVLAILASVSTPLNFTITEGAEWCTLTATPLGNNEYGTKYLLTFDIKPGYEAKTFVINGNTRTLKGGKTFTASFGGKSNVIQLTYKRKTNAVLEARRTAVVDKMKEITGIQYTIDKDYAYDINGRDATMYKKWGLSGLYKTRLYQGMPYTDNSSFSPDAFLDFVTGTNSDGSYILSFNVGNSDYFIGNSCTNAVFWAWSKISSSITFTWSANMIESKGAYVVGDIEILKSDYDSGGQWYDTQVICERNGLEKMAEAYSYMAKGDSMHHIYWLDDGSGERANHAILISEVNVVYKDGVVDPEASYVYYQDQHGGWNKREGHNGKDVYTSCNNNAKKSFKALYELHYIPVSCIELLEESAPMPDAMVTDTLTTYDLSSVTDGTLEFNYAASKVVMEIKNAGGTSVKKVTRYPIETNPKKINMSEFTSTDAAGNKNVYSDTVDVSTLSSGTYTCVVTVYLSNGESVVARNFNFTK